MNELKNLLIKLFKKGFATSEEKSQVKNLYKNLDEEEKEEAKEDVEEAEKLPEEEEGAGDDDAKKDDEKVEDLAKSIADQISKGLKGFGVSQKDLQKKKDISNKGFLDDADVKIAKVKRTGKDITMKMSQVKNLSEWVKCLLRKDFSGMESARTKLEPLIEGTDSEGGYLVPTLLHSAIIELLEDEAVVRPRATLIDMTGMKTNQLNIDGIASKPIAQWSAENADKGTSSMTFNQISLTPYTLAVIVPISKQLRDDTPFNIVSLLAKAMAEGVAKEEDKAFMTANGSGRPTGIDNYTFTTISAGGAVTFDHINSAYWRLPQAYRKNGFWIMNGRTIEVVSMLKDSNNRPLLLDSGIITEPGIPALKGRPVLEQNDIASSKIFFGDLSAYWIGVKQNLTIDIAEEATIRSINLWERNLIAVRVEERVDGELTTTRSFVEISNTGVS
jgi:HK97 family phage major capsid protein